ncbi:MAG: succinate dehydrogenase, cytochrome b556 subunit [Acidisphaera sp.]|nr:succinate dehydrogenase, cytochrome b556 subunit [Acidisphaera sp.]
MTDARDSLTVGRTSDGRLVQRPLSPHLQAYKWPISMASSILHRATGIALSVGTLLLVWFLVAAAASDRSYAAVSGFIHSFVGVVLLLGWIAALWYHFLAGIRHLAWDAGYGYSKEDTDRNTLVIFGATAVCTLLTWILLFTHL